MRIVSDQISELRLIIHPYPEHTTVALVTRNRRGSENFDFRQHAWDLPLPQRLYEGFDTTDQLWAILGSLAARSRTRRPAPRAEPPASPEGDRRGEQLRLDLDPDHF